MELKSVVDWTGKLTKVDEMWKVRRVHFIFAVFYQPLQSVWIQNENLAISGKRVRIIVVIILSTQYRDDAQLVQRLLENDQQDISASRW